MVCRTVQFNILSTCNPCFIPFFIVPFQFTQNLNLLPLIPVLTPFGCLPLIALNPYFWWEISVWRAPFWFKPTLSETRVGRKMRAWCTVKEEGKPGICARVTCQWQGMDYKWRISWRDVLTLPRNALLFYGTLGNTFLSAAIRNIRPFLRKFLWTSQVPNSITGRSFIQTLNQICQWMRRERTRVLLHLRIKCGFDCGDFQESHTCSKCKNWGCGPRGCSESVWVASKHS